MNNLDYSNNPLVLFGTLLCLIGMIIFCFGKKWFVFRWLLNDRSMFFQIIFGFIIFLLGFVMLYVSGVFAS